MTGPSGWRVGSTRSAIYCTLLLGAPGTVSAAAIVAQVTDREPNTTYKTLETLERQGLIARSADRVRGLWAITDQCAPTPPMLLESLADLRAQVLRDVADCPAGVSHEVLCLEFGVRTCEMRLALAPALADGRLVCIDMPARAGGGRGYVLPAHEARHIGSAVAKGVDEHAAALLSPAQLVDLPALYSLEGDHGAYAILADGRLALSWPGATVVVPADATRELFRWLDRLGGVDLAEVLADSPPPMPPIPQFLAMAPQPAELAEAP